MPVANQQAALAAAVVVLAAAILEAMRAASATTVMTAVVLSHPVQVVLLVVMPTGPVSMTAAHAVRTTVGLTTTAAVVATSRLATIATLERATKVLHPVVILRLVVTSPPANLQARFSCRAMPQKKWASFPSLHVTDLHQRAWRSDVVSTTL